ncbi:cell wall synthesis protein CwsA [Mycobacterium hubeiense]|uniref:cell wall synthesis protein CwsA n=1 Tax=Mycobacterium hubeiense TaxID=1867256 RepID=UPI000C7F0645|nr:cell wall synthesis protein CwsA [Mycobacterium sp. QGD 101]
MSATAKTRLTPRERLRRGLTYTAVGPVDITRGTLALGLHGAQSAGGAIRERYRKGRLADQLKEAQETIAQELSAAQEVVASLPEAFQEARRPTRRRRPLLLIGVGAAVLTGGAVAFSIIRRSMQPEPSPRPPSVEVAPKP